jgi:lipoyl(octanoyl) transferase
MSIMQERAARLRSGDSTAEGILYLEHAAVITMGRETLPEHVAGLDPNMPKVPVNRGGQATYHGPGILVGYLVLDLKHRCGREPDLYAYLRAIEQGLMDYGSEVWGLQCERKEGFTGVWCRQPGAGGDRARKIAAIGVGCRRWVSTHGFALNLHPDLEVFRSFVPCGITDAETSSIEAERIRCGRDYRPLDMKEAAQGVHGYLCKALANAGWSRDWFGGSRLGLGKIPDEVAHPVES